MNKFSSIENISQLEALGSQEEIKKEINTLISPLSTNANTYEDYKMPASYNIDSRMPSYYLENRNVHFFIKKDTKNFLMLDMFVRKYRMEVSLKLNETE